MIQRAHKARHRKKNAMVVDRAIHNAYQPKNFAMSAE